MDLVVHGWPRRAGICVTDAGLLVRKWRVSGQATASGGAGNRWPARWSGCGFESDPVAECFELSDVVVFLVAGVEVGVIEVRAQVDELGVGGREQMPDDDQDGAADRDACFLLAASTGDASVAFAEEGVGPARGHGRLTEYPGQVSVAVPGRTVALLAAGGLLDSGCEPGPGAQVRSSREPGHAVSYTHLTL